MTSLWNDVLKERTVLLATISPVLWMNIGYGLIKKNE